MKIVIADDLPASAADLLRAVPGWTVDARPARPAPELVAALADADALIVRSATKVTRPHPACASSPARAPASTTSISKLRPREASS